jgi:hypothetical protein
MAWFLVGEEEDVPVFLTHELLRDVRTAALRDWTSEERVAAICTDPKLALKADNLIQTYLRDWRAADRAGFDSACVEVRGATHGRYLLASSGSSVAASCGRLSTLPPACSRT